MMRLYRALARTIALLAVFALFGGCGRVGPPSHRVGNVTLSDAEFRYGIAPQSNSSVVYQDEVVIVGRGADAVRFASSNGLTWTIDAHAPHAQELTPGKIMFLTNRAVGRVLGMRQNGDNLAVILGPVALTDVIKKADVSFDQPIDLNAMIASTAPDFPGSVVQAPKTSLHTSPIRLALQPLVAFAADSPLTLPEPTVGPPRQITLGKEGFEITPFCCGGLGMRVVWNKDVKVDAIASLRLQGARLVGDLIIDPPGKVRTAKVLLKGAIGLYWKFEAGSTDAFVANINRNDLIAAPVDLWIPLTFLRGPVPFAITLRQSFILKTGFGARNSFLRAKGNYEFGSAEVSVGYENGSWGARASSDLKVIDSLIGTQGGASLSGQGMVLAYQGKIIVGLGAWGFATGPYLGYNTAMGIVQGSDAAGVGLGLPKCRAAWLRVVIEGAVGYSIPQPITDAINVVTLPLRALNVGEIKSFGGFPNPPFHSDPIVNAYEAIPKNCGRP